MEVFDPNSSIILALPVRTEEQCCFVLLEFSRKRVCLKATPFWCLNPAILIHILYQINTTVWLVSPNEFSGRGPFLNSNFKSKLYWSLTRKSNGMTSPHKSATRLHLPICEKIARLWNSDFLWWWSEKDWSFLTCLRNGTFYPLKLFRHEQKSLLPIGLLSGYICAWGETSQPNWVIFPVIFARC